MANWSVSPNTNVSINQSTGEITFPANTSTTDDMVYTISYSSDTNCITSTTYTIPYMVEEEEYKKYYVKYKALEFGIMYKDNPNDHILEVNKSEFNEEESGKAETLSQLDDSLYFDYFHNLNPIPKHIIGVWNNEIYNQFDTDLYGLATTGYMTVESDDLSITTPKSSIEMHFYGIKELLDLFSDEDIINIYFDYEYDLECLTRLGLNTELYELKHLPWKSNDEFNKTDGIKLLYGRIGCSDGTANKTLIGPSANLCPYTLNTHGAYCNENLNCGGDCGGPDVDDCHKALTALTYDVYNIKNDNYNDCYIDGEQPIGTALLTMYDDATCQFSIEIKVKELNRMFSVDGMNFKIVLQNHVYVYPKSDEGYNELLSLGGDGFNLLTTEFLNETVYLIFHADKVTYNDLAIMWDGKIQ